MEYFQRSVSDNTHTRLSRSLIPSLPLPLIVFAFIRRSCLRRKKADLEREIFPKHFLREEAALKTHGAFVVDCFVVVDEVGFFPTLTKWGSSKKVCKLLEKDFYVVQENVSPTLTFV